MMPESAREPLNGTESLQDGWVNAGKSSRKTPIATSPRGADSREESEPWDKVKDGWDEHKSDIR